MIKASCCYRAGSFLLVVAILVACGKKEISVVNVANDNKVTDKSASEMKMPGQEANGTVTLAGIISDSMCGADHAGMLQTGSMGTTDRTCVLECVKAGSKFVLVENGSKKVWRLSDQKLPAEFAGEKVLVQGEISNKINNEIFVLGIRPNKESSQRGGSP